MRDALDSAHSILNKSPCRVTFTYRNWRGEVSTRTVIPEAHGFRFAKSEWHPETQWLLKAWDLQKRDWRTFAMKDISDWEPAP